MSARTAGRLGWSVWALSMALVPVGLVFGVLADSAPHPPGLESILPQLVISGVLGLAFGTVGALVASRRPGKAIGWIFCAVGLTLALSSGATGYADYALYGGGGSRLAAELAVLLGNLGQLTLFIGPALLFLLFPDGRPLSRRWRPVVWLVGAIGAGALLTLAFAPGEVDSYQYPGVESPLGVGGATGDAFKNLAKAGDILIPLVIILAVASMVVRFRRATGRERLQLKWITCAAAAVAVALVLFGSLVILSLPEVVFFLAFLTGLAAIIAVPVAVGIAILRHDLYGIDAVVNRALVYGALTAMLALAYLGSVLLLQFALSPLTQQSDLAIAGSTLAVAALFRPARGRIQAVVDRRFYRRKYDAAKTLEAFSARLRDEVDLDSLSAELQGVVRETMQPAHVSLWLRAPEAGR